MMGSTSQLFLVGLLWGCSNPLMKLGSRSSTSNIVNEERKTCKSIIRELISLGTNWKYVMPLLMNQMGSVLYFFILQTNSILYCVPLANSITFVVTVIMSWILGERTLSKKIMIGIVFMVIGIACHMADLK